jgi:hypothetical protein
MLGPDRDEWQMKRDNSVDDETRKRAQDLRRNMTFPERRLWECLRNWRLAGLEFDRQAPMDPISWTSFLETRSWSLSWMAIAMLIELNTIFGEPAIFKPRVIE